MARGALLVAVALSLTALFFARSHDLAQLTGHALTTALFGTWWIALGLPGRRAARTGEELLVGLAFAAPLLALGARVDGLGSEPGALGRDLGLVATGLVGLIALALAAGRAGAASRVHGLLFVALVLAPPLLGWTLQALADPSGPHPAEWASLPDTLASVSPLALLARCGAAGSPAPGVLELTLALATIALLFAAAERDRREAS